jgi:hypothetical protein
MSQLQKIVYPSMWTPTGSLAWFSAYALTGLADGTLLAAWADASGNGKNASAAGSARPTYKVGVLNGLPGILFNGSNLMSTAAFALNQPTTLCIVGQANNSGYGTFVDGLAPATRQLASNGSTTYYAYAGAGITQTVSNMANFALIDAVFNGAGSLVSYNGIPVTGNAGTANASGLSIGAQPGGSFGLNGYQCEILLFGSALSTSDLQLVQGYRAWRWALQSQLPPGHPYAALPPSVIGGTSNVLPFVYPARNQDPYIPDEQSDTDYSSYGDDQTVLERIDHFIEFDMPQIALGADTENWKAFLDWAAGGGHFDYYSDQASASFTTCHLVSKGNRVAYKYPGMNKLNQAVRFRQVIS